jgi:hypothetical protein
MLRENFALNITLCPIKVKPKPKGAAYQKLCKIGYVKKEGHILPENRKATQKLRRIHPWIQQ